MQDIDVVFPNGFSVYVDPAENGGMRVRVFERNKKRGPKPKPVNNDPEAQKLYKEYSQRAGRLLTDEQVDEALLKMVAEKPGHARSFYEQRPHTLGGVQASQDRKERAMERLLQTRQLRIVNLARPLGRKTHGVYPA